MCDRPDEAERYYTRDPCRCSLVCNIITDLSAPNIITNDRHACVYTLYIDYYYRYHGNAVKGF